MIVGLDPLPLELASLDRGPVVYPKPCCKRLANGGWCLLPDGHLEDHHGIAAKELAAMDWGPIATKRRRF